MSRTDPFLPTDKEQVSLARMFAWRGRLWLLPILPLVVLALSRVMTDRQVIGLMVLAGLAFFTLIAVVLYVSFGLRCPRCAGWIGLGSSRCLSCGLKTVLSRPGEAP